MAIHSSETYSGQTEKIISGSIDFGLGCPQKMHKILIQPGNMAWKRAALFGKGTKTLAQKFPRRRGSAHFRPWQESQN
jgi:hypothetical protein